MIQMAHGSFCHMMNLWIGSIMQGEGHPRPQEHAGEPGGSAEGHIVAKHTFKAITARGHAFGSQPGYPHGAMSHLAGLEITDQVHKRTTTIVINKEYALQQKYGHGITEDAHDPLQASCQRTTSYIVYPDSPHAPPPQWGGLDEPLHACMAMLGRGGLKATATA